MRSIGNRVPVCTGPPPPTPLSRPPYTLVVHCWHYHFGCSTRSQPAISQHTPIVGLAMLAPATFAPATFANAAFLNAKPQKCVCVVSLHIKIHAFSHYYLIQHQKQMNKNYIESGTLNIAHRVIYTK